MAEHHPRADELAEGVIAFLESRTSSDDSTRTAYLTRVALGCLRIIERELRLGPVNDARQLARLRRLLGTKGALPELEAELCRRIRDRQIDLDDPILRHHLDHTAAEYLAIDNPKYSGLQQALARRGVARGDATKE